MTVVTLQGIFTNKNSPHFYELCISVPKIHSSIYTAEKNWNQQKFVESLRLNQIALWQHSEIWMQSQRGLTASNCSKLQTDLSCLSLEDARSYLGQKWTHYVMKLGRAFFFLKFFLSHSSRTNLTEAKVALWHLDVFFVSRRWQTIFSIVLHGTSSVSAW